MRAYKVMSGDGLPGALSRVDVPVPVTGHGQVLIRVRAVSLNYRDSIVVRGGYPRNDTRPVIPVSDAAGTVEALGPGTSRFTVGDAVSPNFMRDWLAGPVTETGLRSGLGGGIDGVLADYVALPEASLVRVPAGYTFAEAATLPCAALTAWNALTAAGTKAGDTVLLLGTGGVSVFGLQFAKALGATAIVTSSDDAKLQRAKTLGADHTVNYRTHPEWHTEVRRITAGRGVDHVLEVGGPGTLERSLASTRVGGTVSLIGLLDNPERQPSVLPALLNAQTIRGIYVGSVEMYESMTRAIEASGIKPVIDRTFPFDDTPAAYAHLASQKHFGKVVINLA